MDRCPGRAFLRCLCRWKWGDQMADLRGPSCLSFYVFDPRSRIRIQLSSSLPQQKLDGSKVSLLHSEVFLELNPDAEVSLTANFADNAWEQESLPGKSFKVLPTRLRAMSVTLRTSSHAIEAICARAHLWLFPCLSETTSVKHQHFLLQS